MPLPVIADTMRVAVRGHAGNGHMWANILHFRKTGALTYAGAIAILDPLLYAQYHDNNGGGSAWRALAHTGASVQDFVYTPLDGSSASTIISHAFAGISGGDALPASMAIVVTLRTALRGRSYRGRNYVGGISDSSVEGVNLVKPAFRAECVDVFNDLIGGTIVTQGAWVVVSRFHDKVPLTTGVTTVVNTVLTVDNVLDSQRRRLPGRGA